MPSLTIFLKDVMNPEVFNGELRVVGQVVGRGVVYCRHGGAASAQPLATSAALQILMVCLSMVIHLQLIVSKTLEVSKVMILPI